MGSDDEDRGRSGDGQVDIPPSVLAAERARWQQQMRDGGEAYVRSQRTPREVTVDDDTMPAFDDQARFYPPTGAPGISIHQGTHPSGSPVNTLLFYDDDATLAGILNHYPAGIPGLQAPSTLNTWVRPDRRGRGIATRLTVESSALGWSYDREAATFSEAGMRLRRRFREVTGRAEAFDRAPADEVSTVAPPTDAGEVAP